MFWHQIKTRGAPFIPIPNEIIPEINRALNISPEETVYDLGSGDGRVLLYLAPRHPKTKFIGVDISYWPYLISIYKKNKSGVNNTDFIKKDIFDQNLAGASKIFVYLLPRLMDKLLPKMKRELRSGTRLVSCDFKFTGKEPTEVIDLNRDKERFGKKLYIYTF
jgi:SAM-dependent methyltransferase